MQIHVGCSGWFYSHWRGIFYPRQELTTKNWFAYYANVFQTVELNASFYRWPRPPTVRRWKRQAPPGFTYTVKVHRRLTHTLRMNGTQELVESFCRIADLLGEKMGCFLWQFPPSFKYTPEHLGTIVAQLGPPHRHVVEFRHASWWRPDVFVALEQRGITFCAVSAPRLPDTIPTPQKRLYVRFNGVTRWYRHDYTPAELCHWARRIRESGAREVWVYFNNDRQAHAVKNALSLRRLLRAADASSPTPPRSRRPTRSRTPARPRRRASKVAPAMP